MIVPLIILGSLGLLMRKKKPVRVAALPPAGRSAEEINTQLWAQAGDDFVVEIYGDSKFKVPPPPSSDAVTASPACDVIAVGKGWWPKAIAYAESIARPSHTPETLAQETLLAVMPLCASSRTDAMRNLRAEMVDRLMMGSVTRNPISYPVGVGSEGFRTKPIGPQAGIFDAFKKIKLPKVCGDIVCPPGWTCHIGETSTSCQQPAPDGSVSVLTARGMRVIPRRGGNFATITSGRRERVFR